MRVVCTALLLLVLLPVVPLYAMHSEGPGLVQAKLITTEHKVAGVANVWNTAEKFVIHLMPEPSWQIHNVQFHIAAENGDSVQIPATKNGFLIPGKFEYQDAFASDDQGHYEKILDLAEDLDFRWGEPYAELRLQNLAIHASVVRVDDEGQVVESSAVWAYTDHGADVNEDGTLNDIEFENMGEGWWFQYELSHPKKGHFVDSPVQGLTFSTPSNSGLTDEAGGFDYFPGEEVDLAIGHYPIGRTVADHRISPLDLYEGLDTTAPEIGNMARLLQTLDDDGEPNGGIIIRPEAITAFEKAMAAKGFTYLDFSNTEQIDAVIEETITQAALAGVTLVEAYLEDAVAHLESTVGGSMFRKNASRTPTLASAKAKLEVMPVWLPARHANGDLVSIDYSDEDGNEIPDGQTGDPAKAKPIITSFTDEDPATGAHDVWVSISRDDGNSWKRKNLSRMADRTSFTLPDGTPVYGHCKKPVIKVASNYILVMWTSKFARGGKPRYAIKTCPEDQPDCIICTGTGENEVCEADYKGDDPYAVDDIWGVQGPQRSVDYTEEGFPEVGVVPYSAVWASRIVIDKTTGDITYYKPERLTSGRRDAYQLFLTGNGGVGFAAVWQEDPEGLRPGDASGPGPGWGGATTSHKTDIWYSSIAWDDFAKVDENFVIGGDPEHDFSDDFEGRPKALVPMSLPMRITDNDALNTDNLMVELNPDTGLPVEDENGNWIPLVNTDSTSYDEQDPNEDGSGSHRYGYMVEGMCETFYEFVNNQGATKRACVTADGRLLDGDTGASRPNIFMQPYYKVNSETGLYEKSAYAIIVYEETKGVGPGPPDHIPDEGPYGDEASPDEGKNVFYHTFDFLQPGVVSGGEILNLPETDEFGNPIYIVDEAGVPILDFQGNKILAYENARRPRLIVQAKSNMGESKTILVALYKEGAEGKGRPSDIMMRRMVVSNPGNPYEFKNFVCEDTRVTDCGKTICVKGAQNVSSPSVVETWLNPYAEPDSNGDNTKVVRWLHTENDLNDKSSANPYDDARAHRGALRGDFLVIGYTWTPNWAASRNGHDKYDFFLRRSFNGGKKWSTDPNGNGVSHSDTFKIYTEGETEDDDEGRNTYTVDTFYEPGEYEAPRNISKLKNNKETIAEPRIVGTPGTIWKKGPGMNPDGTSYDGIPTGYPEDVQDDNVFWIAYGTAENPPKSADGEILDDDGDEDEHAGAPLDLFYTFSQDRGENFKEDTWEVNPDSDGNYAGEIVTRMPRLAKGDPEQGECQLRMTPDGSRFYATWLQEGVEGSDIWMRRMMPNRFQRNVGTAAGQ